MAVIRSCISVHPVSASYLLSIKKYIIVLKKFFTSSFRLSLVLFNNNLSIA